MRPYLARPLPRSFYARPTLVVAPALLGKIVVHDHPGGVLAARIVEVEAYLGQLDPASHAYRGPTGRAAIMYGQPGRLYVYFTYGMHYCMNAIAHDGRHAGGILIRAAEPVLGRARMAAHRGFDGDDREPARGPACLTQSLGIGPADNGTDLVAGRTRIHPPRKPEPFRTGASVRIGISKAADKPWRFFVCGSAAVSGPPKLNRC